ncbi:MAG: carboxypeptidase-like regulatory domain-containing protein [Saprospiraceae bacterium]
MSKYITLLLLLLPALSFAQNVRGKIINNLNDVLVGADVYWQGFNRVATTDENGEFVISAEGVPTKNLIAVYVGHFTDTIAINQENYVEFVLEEIASLNAVVVTDEQPGVIISDFDPIKSEQLTEAELVKSACCDLAGCFETQTTVQPQTTNVVTNSKELRISGLSGVYNQVLIDGFPMIQGLTYTYGISSIPGTLVKSIFIAKGANSVLQGYESISGQINVVTKAPDDTDKVYANIYANSFLEKHFNLNYAFKQGKWSNLTTLHSVQPANRVDRDEDGFMDLPLLTRYAISNKWKYGKDNEIGWNSTVGLRFMKEERVGGQVGFNADRDKGSLQNYGNFVDLTQTELWTKTAYRFNGEHNLAFFASGYQQQQNSFFGTVLYDAKQTNFYANIQYEFNYTPKNVLKTGVSYRYLNLKEDVDFTENTLLRTYAAQYLNEESIPGVFAEHTMQLLDDQLTWIAGVRGDYHNEFGFAFTPRTLVKYNLTPSTIVRANIGTGWRTVNLFSENINLLVSSRDIVFTENLEPERALNAGVNVTQKFQQDQYSGYFSVDFYHTNFQNQIFPDYDTDPSKAFIKNFNGTSISNSFQAELSLKIIEQFSWKLGYNLLDVYREIEGKKQVLPFNAKHKLLTTFSYEPLSKRYHFDMNVHWYGKQVLPNTESNPIEYRRGNFSDPYTLVNAQFTYSFEKFEIYTGCENIFDFRQEQPIISSDDPFSPYFDTSSVWGPTRGREFYLGLRFRLP